MRRPYCAHAVSSLDTRSAAQVDTPLSLEPPCPISAQVRARSVVAIAIMYGLCHAFFRATCHAVCAFLAFVVTCMWL